MKTFPVKVSNFQERSLTIEMYASIHCSNWSVHFDIWAACYLLVFKLREKPHVAWNNYRNDKTGEMFEIKSLYLRPPPLFLTCRKRRTTWQIMERNTDKRCCNIIVFLTTARNRKFSMGRTRFFSRNWLLHTKKHYIDIGTWIKSWQLPYTNKEKFWPVMAQALLSDHLGLKFWLVPYLRFDCISSLCVVV